MARKPRDYDAELQALMEKAKKVRTQKTVQLGELVQIVGADALPIEALAGVLLSAVEQAKKQPEAIARWTERGQTFFQQGGKRGKKTQPATLLQQLQETMAQLRRLTVQRNRLDLDRARDDTRQWVQDRRTRTRQLDRAGRPRAEGRPG